MDNSVGEQTPTFTSDNTDYVYPILKDRYNDPITSPSHTTATRLPWPG